MPVLHQFTADSAAAITSLVDIAATVESRLHDSEGRVRALQHDVQQLRHRQDQFRQWLVLIRRTHRSQSHAATSRAIKNALCSLESDSGLVLSLF